MSPNSARPLLVVPFEWQYSNFSLHQITEHGLIVNPGSFWIATLGALGNVTGDGAGNGAELSITELMSDVWAESFSSNIGLL